MTIVKKKNVFRQFMRQLELSRHQKTLLYLVSGLSCSNCLLGSLTTGNGVSFHNSVCGRKTGTGRSWEKAAEKSFILSQFYGPTQPEAASWLWQHLGISSHSLRELGQALLQAPEKSRLFYSSPGPLRALSGSFKTQQQNFFCFCSEKKKKNHGNGTSVFLVKQAKCRWQHVLSSREICCWTVVLGLLFG